MWFRLIDRGEACVVESKPCADAAQCELERARVVRQTVSCDNPRDLSSV